MKAHCALNYKLVFVTAAAVKDIIILKISIVKGVDLLSKIKSFSEISGLELNTNKSFAMCMGQNNIYGNQHLGIKFVNSLKILGVHFDRSCAAGENPKNWESKITKLEKIFAQWTKRDLSIMGKIIIVKTFGLSQFVYLLQSISLPSSVLQKINRIIFSYT